MRLDLYDRARAHIAADGFTPGVQTRIAAFVGAAKAVNMPFLTLAMAGPAQSLAWQALASQAFREAEAMTLLTRVTQWSLDPRDTAAAAALAAPLWAEAARAGFAGFPASAEGVSLDALAFGHALLARIRLAPIVPEAEAAHPFAVALMRIEQENGRLLQTQIRLLKDGFATVPVVVREDAVAAKTAIVDTAFAHLLESLAPTGARPRP
jgi:hypothetical protein